jgi:hypothetical protein
MRIERVSCPLSFSGAESLPIRRTSFRFNPKAFDRVAALVARMPHMGGEGRPAAIDTAVDITGSHRRNRVLHI